MSDLRINTILGATLAAALGALGLREVSNAVYHPHFAEEPGYLIAVADVTAPAAQAGAAEAPVTPDWGVLLADDATLATLVSEGETISGRLCAACHTFASGGANGTGPALYGVFGRTAGTHAGYNYSSAMAEYAQPWAYDNLYNFLAAPGRYIRGTQMAFAGLRQTDDRVAVVAYLRSLAPSPAPLPAPLPPADTAPGVAPPAAATADQVPAEAVGGAQSNAAPQGAANSTPPGLAPENPGAPPSAP